MSALYDQVWVVGMDIAVVATGYPGSGLYSGQPVPAVEIGSTIGALDVDTFPADLTFTKDYRLVIPSTNPVVSKYPVQIFTSRVL